jgi:DNA-binding NtrC family response regulator
MKVLKPEPPKKQYCILVVEDEEDSREMYKEELAEAGYKVLCAENSSQALETLEKEKIDLVMTDIRMPVGSGASLAVWLHTYKPDMPIIVATAYQHYEEMLKGEEKIVRAFFVKPVHMDDLKKAIAEILK